MLWLIRCAVGLVLWQYVPVARGQDAPSTAVTPDENETAAESDTSAHAQPTADDIARALRRYQHEPTVSDVIGAASAHQRTSPGRVAALASRARSAGWFPTLRLSARRGQTIDLLAAQSTTTDRNSASTGDDLVLEAQLVFDLSKIVWSNSELRVEREVRAEREAKQELTQLVTSLYFERRRVQLQRDLSGTTSIAIEMRIAEIEGLLDGLTANAFSRMLQNHRSH